MVTGTWPWGSMRNAGRWQMARAARRAVPSWSYVVKSTEAFSLDQASTLLAGPRVRG